MAKSEKKFIDIKAMFSISEDEVYIIYNGIKYKKVPTKGVKKDEFDWTPMFETLWKLYPRKIERQNAIKMFERKVRGLTEEECREKCNYIYKLQMRYVKQLEENETPLQYVKHYSSWLNAEIPNSKYFKGK